LSYNEAANEISAQEEKEPLNDIIS